MELEAEIAIPTAVMWIVVMATIIIAPKAITGNSYPFWQIIVMGVVLLPITYLILQKMQS
jgi:hypothetical protein